MTFQRIQLLVLVIALPFGWQSAAAQQTQHSDVFFYYGETKIEVGEQDGRRAYPQVMPQGDFFCHTNGNPGFFSERDLGGGTGPGDRIGYNILGDLVFWTDGAFAAPRADTQIRIVNNPSSVGDTLIGTETGEQRASFSPLLNSIGQSSSAGDFHSHVDYRLEPSCNDPDATPRTGAYGIKMSLSTNAPEVQDSAPFFLVWRFGMDQSQFNVALDDFDALLDELTSVSGDFNRDGMLTAIDIDLLSQEVAAGSNESFFDLTGDATVNEADRRRWVEELNGTFFGDTNLDGSVQFSDFLAMSAGFGKNGGWAEGDFDGSGDVAFPDFLVLSANFGQGSGEIANVPEPGAYPVGVIVSFLPYANCVRKRQRLKASRFRARLVMR